MDPFAPRRDRLDSWEALFPIASAWAAAYRQAGEFWFNAASESTRVFAELAHAQTRLLSHTLAATAAMGVGSVADQMMQAGLAVAEAQSERAVEAVLQSVEEIGPGDREFIPLPE